MWEANCPLHNTDDIKDLTQEVTALGGCISVPVGKCTLGRMFNVHGKPIDIEMIYLIMNPGGNTQKATLFEDQLL